MIRQLCTGALAFGLMVLPVGCGVDDTSEQAQFEKALMAMDNGNYASAEQILSGLCSNGCADALRIALAESQMGISGIVLTDLLVNLTNGSATTEFQALQNLFGAINPNNPTGPTGASTADLLALNDAFTNLSAIPNPDSGVQLQIAIAGAALLVGEVTNDPNLYDPATGAFMPASGTGVVDANFITTVVTPTVAAITTSLDAVATALFGSTGITGSTTVDDLNAVVNTIDTNGNCVASLDPACVPIDATELNTFLTGLNLP